MECREGRPCIGDTYIERKFHENCQKSVLGNNLWSDWLYNANSGLLRPVLRSKTAVMRS